MPAGLRAFLRAKGSFALKRQNRRFREAEFVDPDFAEALCDDKSGRQSADRKAQRKTQQFCRQVQRALNLALADCSLEGCDLFVEEVSPTPDCGHLLAHVVVSDGYAIADVMSALRSETPRLRSEVAMAIARKRAPELAFIPAFLNGGEYE